MTDEDRLVTAIVEAPDDDGPRLVYADYLLGCGDVRGELIALQCALAAADAVDTPLADEAAAVARERELMTLCRPQLIAGLPEAAGYIVRRGFVEHAAVLPYLMFSPTEADGVTPRGDIVEEMRACAPLLRSVAITTRSLEVVVPGPAWRAIDSLSLVEPDANAEVTAALLASPHLACVKRLSVINTSNTCANAALASPQQLEHLSIYGGSVGRTELDGDAIAIAIGRQQRLAGVRSLHLGRCRFTSVAAMRELAERPIEQLSLHHCGGAEHILALIRALPRLHTLELDDEGGNLGKLDLAAVVAAAPELRRLRVQHHDFDERLAKTFAGSPHNARLRRLELVHCRLSDRTARTLLASTHLSSLARLDLTGTNASAAAKQRAARLSWRTRPFYPRSIEEPLMLEGNRIASIKEYRGVAETGLANAKMAVERIWEEIVEPPNCVGAVPRWVR